MVSFLSLLWQHREKKYSAKFKKDFVGTPQYKASVKLIISEINNILSLCDKGTDNFNAIDISSVLGRFEDIDFNDSYYIELSSFSKYKIVTDDQDFISFKNHNQEILTIIRN